MSTGDHLHLKTNRKLASGGRVTNGELVTVKSVHPDGGVELTDGRILDSSFREFLPGYAVTSYALARQDGGLRLVFRLNH